MFSENCWHIYKISLYLSQHDIQHNIEVQQFEDMKKLKKISPSNLVCKP